MFKKIIIAVYLTFISLPGLAFANEFNESPAQLVSSMDYFLGANLGDTVEIARQNFSQPPYSQEWTSTYSNSKIGLAYKPILNVIFKDNYTIQKKLLIGSDLTGKINKISYFIYYREKELYTDKLNALIQEANNNFGTSLEITSQISNRDAQHHIWSSESKNLSIIHYYHPEYNRQYPYVILIVRAQS